MKKWLLAPLIDIEKINDRLDAIEDLNAHTDQLESFRANIAKMPDLERYLAQLYKYSVR